jgi:tRNA dimethylallyltransferase
MERSAQPAVAIVGPTASGKSCLAIEVAKLYKCEIVNCDSVQVYRGFVIGAAKVRGDQQQGIPQHLLDIAGPGDDFTAGDYAREARKALRDISSRGRLPIVAGGTGFYLKALLHGLSPAPPRDEALRDRLRRASVRRPAALHRLLRLIDFAAAGRIHPNDHQKLIRAIEIAATTRRSVTEVQGEPRDELRGYRILKIGLAPPRTMLHEAVNQRTARMFASGLLEEARELLAVGYSPESKPMQSLGYQQALRVIAGEASEAEAIEDCQAKTRQYVKRQMTWFRRDKEIRWMEGFGTDRQLQMDVFSLVSDFMRSFVHSDSQARSSEKATNTAC